MLVQDDLDELIMRKSCCKTRDKTMRKQSVLTVGVVVAANSASFRTASNSSGVLTRICFVLCFGANAWNSAP